jgi:hypothetical protein
MRKSAFLFFFFAVSTCVHSQELQARVSIITSKVSTTVDKKIFQTLQTGLTNFLNGRKWTNDAFQAPEKIQCSFLLTIDQDKGNNVFKGKLTIQAARPIFNTNYDSPIINFLDDDVTFKYIEFQPIEFNENRVQGPDPFVSNLTAVFAYWANIIIGFDYGSFAIRGGDNYFQKAWNIVNNAPENADIHGWKSFENLRNRYWLAENLNNSRFALFHDALYSYYRNGMDVFFDNEEQGRLGIFNCINFLNSINNENPNSMLLQFFFQGKSNELMKSLSKGSMEIKNRSRDILSKLDLTNASTYKELK